MSDLIGKEVQKRSGRPFKSGLKKATVKAVTTCQYTGNPGYSFEEDDSVVECSRIRETDIPGAVNNV